MRTICNTNSHLAKARQLRKGRETEAAVKKSTRKALMSSTLLVKFFSETEKEGRHN